MAEPTDPPACPLCSKPIRPEAISVKVVAGVWHHLGCWSRMLVLRSMETRERSDAVTARSRTVFAFWQARIEHHRTATGLPAVHFGLPPSLLARLTLDAERPNSRMSPFLRYLVRNGQQDGAIVPLAADGLKVYACAASASVAREVTAWIRELVTARIEAGFSASDLLLGEYASVAESITGAIGAAQHGPE
jgi:hypothetical protein